MTDDRSLIAARGGIRGLARKLGHTNHTTVQGWWQRNRIPPARMDEVLTISPVEQKSAA